MCMLNGQSRQSIGRMPRGYQHYYHIWKSDSSRPQVNPTLSLQRQIPVTRCLVRVTMLLRNTRVLLSFRFRAATCQHGENNAESQFDSHLDRRLPRSCPLADMYSE